MLKTRLLAFLAAFAVGSAPMAAFALPVAAPVYTSGGQPVHATGIICLNLDGSSCAFGGGAASAYGPTPVGSSAANPPVVMGGTADGTATGNVSVWKVDPSGYGWVNVTNSFMLDATGQSLKTDLDTLVASISNPIPAGASLIGHVDGAGGASAALVGNPNRMGCRAATTDPTAAADTQLIDEMCGATGKRIMLPYAIKELMVRGSTGAQTGTGAQAFTGISAPTGSNKFYMTGLQCSNSGASASIVTLNDSASTIIINPAGGGNNPTFAVPLVWAAATAPTANFGTASTSQYCSAQGYTGL